MQPFRFDSLIYGGYDFPADGIGNHLSLLDRLVFNSTPPRHKSLHALPVQDSRIPPYGGVPAFAHLREPDLYKNGLYLDISRDMGNESAIAAAGQRAVDYKHAFNAVTGLYLMWETNRLSAAARRLAACYDFVIVTSRMLDRDLENAGLDWVFLPHPYDYALPQRLPPREPGAPVVFGISAGLWPRKNVALLAESFADTFGNDSGVRLKIHTRFDPQHPDYRAEADRLKAVLERVRNIDIEARHFSREEYLEWLASLDVYCFISAGEGYSVTPREALHLGKPVVLLDAHVHSEFSHLPGVVRVRSSGMKPAVANHAGLEGDMGDDWLVDHGSLAGALVRARDELHELQAGLQQGMEQVLAVHDLDRIRAQWVTALNDRHRMHVDRVCRQFPPSMARERARILPDLDEPAADADLPLRHATGESGNRRVYCFRKLHSIGHCLYGQDYRPRKSAPLTVRFSIRLIDVDEDAKCWLSNLVSLDVYDNRNDRMLSFMPLTYRSFNDGAGQFELRIDGETDQVLEFRVYWHGNCDISVQQLSLR